MVPAPGKYRYVPVLVFMEGKRGSDVLGCAQIDLDDSSESRVIVSLGGSLLSPRS